jgi:hypothetical protein
MKIRKLIRFHQKDEETKQILVDLHGNTEEDFFNIQQVPWNADYQFNPFDASSDSSTPEENFTSMNEIFDNLLSMQRFQRKIFLVKRKGIQAKSKLSKIVKKKEKKELDPVLTAKATMYRNKIKKSIDEKKIIKEMLRMDQEIPVERISSKPNFTSPRSHGFTSPRSPGLMSPIPSSFRKVSPGTSNGIRTFNVSTMDSMNRAQSEDSLQDLSSRKVSPSSDRLLSGNYFDSSMPRTTSEESIQDSFCEEKDENRKFIKK